MPKAVSHVVRRPGRRHGDPDVEIPVAEDLATVPGAPIREKDMSFFSRTEPPETQNLEKGADREWAWSVYTPEVAEYRKGHDERMIPHIELAADSGDVQPTGEPDPTVDVTDAIRRRARELEFGEVGFTRLDRRFIYASRKGWAKFSHAICLAFEQDYDQMQTIPSIEAEYAHFGTYEIESVAGEKLADYIRELGYHAQIHSPSDSSGPYIPMFVAAGLGQLGAIGQLLSPHFGSRSRLMIISTDAPVRYDEPIDYGFHKFCQKCQVCVNRCPGRALVKEQVWYRGVQKNKLIYDRCRPVMVTYEGCAICMKVCPVQKFGMEAVMKHYVETGEVLGKGTEELETYELREKGSFGPGELPQFDRQFFEIPHGRKEDWLFEQLKDRLDDEVVPPADDLKRFAGKVKDVIELQRRSRGDD